MGAIRNVSSRDWKKEDGTGGRGASNQEKRKSLRGKNRKASASNTQIERGEGSLVGLTSLGAVDKRGPKNKKRAAIRGNGRRGPKEKKKL